MWIKNKSKQTQIMFFLVMVIGLTFRLFVSWQPISTIILKNLPDDAYYYFVLARNAIHTGNISLDGINSTNGFHPLWLILLLPIFGWNAPLGDLQVHLALTLSSLLDLVTMWAISQIVYYFTNREDVSILSIFIYAINPIVILQVTNGLETSLMMALLITFIWMTIKWLSDDYSWIGTIKFGLIGGLTFLARSDTIFFLVLLFAGALVFWGIKAGFGRLLFAGSISSIVVVPWLIWGKVVTGAWMQVSGIAVPYAIINRFAMREAGPFLIRMLDLSIHQISYPTFWLRGDPTGLPLIMGVFLWTILLGLLIWRSTRIGSRIEKSILIPLLLASLALVLVHAGIRWYPRPWYFIPTAAIFAIGSALGIAYIVQNQRTIFLITMLFSAYFLITGYIFWQIGYYPWQEEMLAANQWLEKNVSQEDKIGSFNAGIYAYYSGRTIINLDGVVNNNAFEAIKDSNLISYIHQSGIKYLIDYDHAVQSEYGPFLGEDPKNLDQIAILGGSGSSDLGMLRVYRVMDP